MATPKSKSNHMVLKRVLIGVSITGNVLFLLLLFAFKLGYLDWSLNNYVFEKMWTPQNDEFGYRAPDTICFTLNRQYVGILGLAAGYHANYDLQGHLIDDDNKISCLKGFRANPDLAN